MKRISLIKRKPKAKSLGWWRTKCDSLMQEINRTHYQSCFLGNHPNQVAHHFVPKSVSSILRYDWENLIPLCNACHMRLHQSGDPWYEHEIIKRKGGSEWFEKLRLKGRQINTVNIGRFREIYAELSTEARKYGLTPLDIER